VSLRTRWLLVALLFVAALVLAVQVKKAQREADERFALAKERLETAQRIASMQNGDLDGLLARLGAIARFEKEDLGAAVKLRFGGFDRLKSERILAALLSSAASIEELRIERDKERCDMEVRVAK